jgi:hypothetical protein
MITMSEQVKVPINEDTKLCLRYNLKRIKLFLSFDAQIFNSNHVVIMNFKLICLSKIKGTLLSIIWAC